MRPISITVISLALLFASGPAKAEFRITESQEALRKIQGRMAIDDLAVMEKGLLGIYLACSRDGALFMLGSNILAEEASNYSSIWRVQRKQENKVVLTAEAGSKAKRPVNVDIAQVLQLALGNDCNSDRYTNTNLFEVESINGKSTSAELLKDAP